MCCFVAVVLVALHWPPLSDVTMWTARDARPVSSKASSTWAVQFHPHGGQFDFARLSARTMHPHGGARVVSLTKSRKIPTRKLLPPFFVSTHRAKGVV